MLAARHFFNLASLLVLRYGELHYVMVCDGSSLQQWSGKRPCITVEASAIEIALQVGGVTLQVGGVTLQVDNSTVRVN